MNKKNRLLLLKTSALTTYMNLNQNMDSSFSSSSLDLSLWRRSSHLLLICIGVYLMATCWKFLLYCGLAAMVLWLALRFRVVHTIHIVYNRLNIKIRQLFTRYPKPNKDTAPSPSPTQLDETVELLPDLEPSRSITQPSLPSTSSGSAASSSRRKRVVNAATATTKRTQIEEDSDTTKDTDSTAKTTQKPSRAKTSSRRTRRVAATPDEGIGADEDETERRTDGDGYGDGSADQKSSNEAGEDAATDEAEEDEPRRRVTRATRATRSSARKRNADTTTRRPSVGSIV